jgi:hypothetical protein
MEEFQAGIITPVEVFHHDQLGVRSGMTDQEVRQGLKATALLLFGIK